jgi:hypothetical protein
MAFDPRQHLTKISGRDYLPVSARVEWFRDVNPDGSITVEMVALEPYPVFKATIIAGGQIVATDYGSAQITSKAVYAGREIEKASTAAIGRALALAGFGTQFTDDFSDEGHIADTPRANGTPQVVPRNAPPPEAEDNAPPEVTADWVLCEPKITAKTSGKSNIRWFQFERIGGGGNYITSDYDMIKAVYKDIPAEDGEHKLEQPTRIKAEKNRNGKWMVTELTDDIPF